jgi:hypothetical protein
MQCRSDGHDDARPTLRQVPEPPDHQSLSGLILNASPPIEQIDSWRFSN